MNWSSSSLFKHFRNLTYRLLYWWQCLYINITYATYRRAYKNINIKITAVWYATSLLEGHSYRHPITYVTFLQVRNMVNGHWQWYGSSTSRKWMSQYSSMSATCRLHTEILHCKAGHVIGWTVTHFKTLGTTELWCPMDRELLEIHRWNYDEVSQIVTYSQLHKLH